MQGAQSAFDHRCYVEYEAKCAKHIKIQSRLLWVFFCLLVSETSLAVIYAQTQFASCFYFLPLVFCPFLSSSFSRLSAPLPLPCPPLLFTFPATDTTTCITLLFPLLITVGHLRQQGFGQSRHTMKCQLLTPSSVVYLAASRSSWAIYRACQNQANNGILYNVAISLTGKAN